MVEYPAGIIPVVSAANPLVTSRITDYTFEVLDRNEGLKGVIESVIMGSVTWRRNALIKGGGKLKMLDRGNDIDWLNDRIRISTTVNGVQWSLGVWIPTAPTGAWKGPHRSWDIDLHDKSTVLDEDRVTQTTFVNSGADVLDTVVNFIHSAGEYNISATDIGATVATPMVWPPGTSKLRIINDLLDSSGYFTLRVSPDGAFLIQPYLQPSQRPYRYEFLDNEESIYAEAFSRKFDNFSVPNRIIATSTADFENVGFVASAENLDPDSDYSYPSRQRWVTRYYENVEAVSEDALATWCQRKLADWTSPTASEDIDVMPVPLDIYDAVRFRNDSAGIDVRATVETVKFPLNALELASVSIREVATVSTTTGTDVWTV